MQANQLGLIWNNSNSCYCRYVTDLKGQQRESRPTKNDRETPSAAGVTRPQISGTYCTSTLRWQVHRCFNFVYGLLSLMFTNVLFSYFFEILFYFLLIHIVTCIFALPCHGVPYIVNMEQNFVLKIATTMQILEFLLCTFLFQVVALNRFCISIPTWVPELKFQNCKQLTWTK